MIDTDRESANIQFLEQIVDIIYSAESAQNLWSLCSNKEQQWLKNITLVVGGKRLASIVGTLGFAKNPIIAENPSDEAMLNALIVWANNT